MIIDKLKINNFKKFSDLEVEFSRGINIVVGPNETGKSTLTRALIEAIYADPTTKSKTFYDQISPWNKANDLKLELEFHNNDAKFRLKKDFQAKSIIFENLDTGLKLTSFKEVSEAIKELTGIPTKEIYESTAFVKQSDIASIDNSNDFIASVQKAASSNSVKVNVHNVMSELSKELKKLNVGVNNPAKHPGPIKQVTDKLKELKAELADKSVKWEKINTESVSKKQYDTELVDIDESIKVTETLIENYRKRKEALKQLEVINKQILQTEEKINSVSEAAQKRDAIKANLAKYERFQSVDVNAIDQEVGELSAAKKVIAGELERLNGLLEQVKNKKIKKSSNTQLVFAGAIALAAAAIGLIISIVISNYLFLAISMIVGVIVVGSAWILQQVRPQYTIDSSKVSGVEEQISLMQQKSEINSKQLQSLLGKFGVEDEGGYYTMRGEYLTSKEQLKELEGGIQGTLGKLTLEEVKQQQLELMTQKKQIEVTELTEEVRNAELTPEQYLAKTRELDKLYLEKKQLDQKQTESKVRVEDAEISRSDIVNLEEQIAIAEENLKYYRMRSKALEIALESMQEALADTASNASKIVSDLIEKYLPRLTKGRYKNARLNDDLSIEVFSDEKNDWVDPVGNLSSGTVDQVYFLARIAFLMNLTHDASVPIILDDPFVTFDKERKEEANLILQDLVKDHQIVLLTHENTYNSWGKVIELAKLLK